MLAIARALISDLWSPTRELGTDQGHPTPGQGLISLVAATNWPYRRQHRLLSPVGPLVVIITLFIAVIGFLIGFSLLLYGLTGESVEQVVTAAGSGLLTLGG